MRLSIDCRFFGKSGIGTFISNIVDSIVKNHNDNDYLLIVEKHIDKYDKFSNIKQLECSIKPFSIKELLFFPVEEINKTDAFFSPYINIPCRIKVPVYSTIHDVIFWDVPGMVSKLGLFIRSFFVKHSISCSSKIFTVSNFSKKRIIHNFNVKKDIEIVYNGVSKVIKDCPTTNCKEDYILFVGNIKAHKGLEVLFKSFCIAKSKSFAYKLKIVGERNNFRTSDNSFYQLVSDNSDVIFTGRLSDSELVNTISTARALILPSYYEGFGIPPLESLYLGTNVILSDIEVLKEIYSKLPVTFFKCGSVEDLSDKLLQIDTLPTLDVDNVREVIASTYNYLISADKILSVISSTNSVCL